MDVLGADAACEKGHFGAGDGISTRNIIGKIGPLPPCGRVRYWQVDLTRPFNTEVLLPEDLTAEN